MCGIIGYIGKQQALPIILDGLKNMEYRGYDSSGICVINATNRSQAAKGVGKISSLLDNLREKSIEGTIGCGHNRWATHGGVTLANAHPHQDCSGTIWIAHNGIIENYKTLKSELVVQGHHFKSETDSEVLAHLIEKHAQVLPLEEAVRKTLQEVQGTYGLVVLKAGTEKVVAARNFSPLLIGVGDNEYFVASDVSAVLKHTTKVIYLDDGEMAVLTPHSHRIFDLSNNLRNKPTADIEWSFEEAKKTGFPHFMLKEIYEEPEAIENSIRGRLIHENGTARLGGLTNVLDKLKTTKRIIISACGTAYLAGLVGEYMLEEYAGIPTEVEWASEFRYRKPVFQEGDAFLAISQSGETADTLAALREAKEKGVLTLGIVNVVGSTIARDTHAGIYQHIGPEVGVASTKAFTSQVAILSLLSLLLGRQRNLSLVVGERIVSEMKKIPELIKKVIAQSEEIKKIAAKYQNFNNFLFLGRKYNFPVAMEGALKLKEISYVHAEGYSSGEMKHGPIAMIDQNFPSFFIAPSDSVYEKVVSNMQEVKARGGPIIAIATEGNQEILDITSDVIYIPKTLEMLTPLLSVIPLQLFAYHFGVLRGNDVDRPRNLAKSVTVE